MILRIDRRIVKAIKAFTFILLVGSVATKLFCIPYISNKFHALGISEFCYLLGSTELISIAFFYYEKTIGLGVVLLACYLGGAIATDIHSTQYLYQPVVVLSFVILTAILKKPEIFHSRFYLHDDINDNLILFQIR